MTIKTQILRDFRQINFGYTSAEQEGVDAPELLLDGYLDIHGISDAAFMGKEFLVLGYKGTGKSAVAERLRLMHQNDSQIFLTQINLEEFPYASFSQVVKNNDSPESKYPAAWSWILLIYIMASFVKDQLMHHPNHEAFDDTISALKEMGLMPIPGLHKIVRYSSKSTFKLTIPKFLESSREKNEIESSITAYVENLKKLVCDVRTESKHLIVIDGLDEIVTNETSQWSSLGALIFEVNRLNILFKKNSVSAKIVLLCRTDIFELIAGANKNKIRQDSSVELDWYSDPNAPSKSMLAKIANLRARLAFGCDIDIFQDIIPRRIYRGKYKRLGKDGRSTIKVLLDTTRHTPRDFLQLLKYIQKCCSGPSITEDNVKSGMREYSIKYFFPEILDELEGYCTGEEAKEFFQVVGSMRSREFSASQLHKAAASEQSILSKEKIDTVLRALFECSAIGNVQKQGQGRHFLTYRFRNRHATFNMKETILLHRGLWRALNMPSDPNWDDETVDPEKLNPA